MSQWMDMVSGWLGVKLWGAEIWRYCLALVIIFASFYAKKVLAWFVYRSLKKIAGRTAFKFDDILVAAAEGPIVWTAVAYGIYLSLALLNIQDNNPRFFNTALWVMTGVFVVAFLLRLVDGTIKYLMSRFQKTDTALDNAVLPVISAISKVFIIIIFLLLLMANLGFDVMGLLAGLGVGGLAVALAAQATLSNWFGAFSIFSDRPFTAGDRVKIGDADGTIETVGLRSTRIRTLDGTLVTIPNSTVANGVISNISKTPGWKHSGCIGITYETPAEKVEEALEIIRDILKNDPGVRPDYMVCFEELAAYSLNIRVLWWSIDADWKKFMATRESVNLSLLRRFSAAGIEFAYPTQTLLIKSGDDGRQGPASGV